ncbi:MAG: polysaccharide deacetylase family protein [Candidatus Hodarchaeales archaeon]|jgi:peptidoglycan/xylan/chitin deacetylase (PgdA/CDA1 family)
MISFIVCVDLDRDAPFPVHGISHAVSIPLQDMSISELRDPVKAMTIEGTRQGLLQLVTLLNDLEIPAVFFHEARTLQMLDRDCEDLIDDLKVLNLQHGLHGFDHEDYSGKMTGVKISRLEQQSLIEKGKELVNEITGEEISLFRAPYMELGDHLPGLLVEADIFQDSSIYREATTAVAPEVSGKIVEFPVIKTPKLSSFDGMYTYLWPLFEGSRSLDEITKNYLALLDNSKDSNKVLSNCRYISINLHPWHLAFLVKEKRYFTKKESLKRSEELKKLLMTLKKADGNFSLFKDL